MAGLSDGKLGRDGRQDQGVPQEGGGDTPGPHHHPERQDSQDPGLPLGKSEFVDDPEQRQSVLQILQPEQLKEVIDFGIPEDPLNLDQLLVDCKDTLKYQVKTGRTLQSSTM